MRRRAIAATTLLLLSLVASPARADDCDARAAELVARFGGAVQRRTETGTILMKHPLTSSVSIQCPTPSFPIGFSTYFASAYPPAAYYDFSAQAGAVVTGLPADMIREGLVRCVTRALKSKDELLNMNFGQVRLECQAFTRDGGSSGVTFYPRRAGD